MKPVGVHWGAKDASTRGPLIATNLDKGLRNVIGHFARLNSGDDETAAAP